MPTPGQFCVNEAWIVVRINEDCECRQYHLGQAEASKNRLWSLYPLCLVI